VKQFVILMAAGLVLAAHGSAAQARMDCAHAMVQRDINDCAIDEYRRVDVRLNDTYQAALARRSLPERLKLRAAQRIWIHVRDADCERESRPERGGSIYPTVYYSCLAEKTKMRTRELQRR
jgi:uncharacterized protein YecT (DUF1311 family)